MDRQVEQVALEHADFTNGNAEAGTRYVFNISDYNIRIDPEFYTGDAYNKAISGFLRQNLRGLRTKISIEYESSLEASLLTDLTNDLVTALADNNNDSVDFLPDASKTDSFAVVLESGYSLVTNYNSTVGNFEPTIELIALEEITSIPDYLIAP